ncbi:helix-turn-helix domain-containing protein [Kordia jejudonensis]|uniref:helix-turn-helix domain-containing protein n=1 Tax=Kordia jejudonensis TaxID=1348245 RepID=UPI00062989C9|nr:AraC family transcriptional regulator [Kordia jejudonensis]
MSIIKKQKVSFLNLEKLHMHLDGTLEVVNGINTLHFDNANGVGRMKHLVIDDVLETINLEVSLTSNLTFSLGNLTSEAIHFIFCLEGHCSHSFENSPKIKKIEELQTAVTENCENIQSSIHIRPKVNTIINIISLDKSVYFKKQNNAAYLAKSQLISLLETLNLKEKQIYFGSYSLKIGEYVKSLLDSNEEDYMTESMRFQGLSHFILANHIDQLYHESIKSENSSVLNNRELKSILSAIELINANPQDAYSIDMLCGITRLSPAKLQEGFKTLHNRTVSDYIRHVRLIEAQRLIVSSDLNISEIVYSVGFTSRSYFCKIFKREYGCSPRQYKKKVRQ